ncbi:MAG: protein YgfX [Thioalkalivibrio sp.]
MRPEPSRRLALWLCLLHGLAGAGFLAAMGTLALPSLPLLSVSLAWHLRGLGFFRHAGQGVALRFQTSGLTQLMDGEGAWQEARVLPGSLCLSGLCVLQLQLQVAGRRCFLAIASDCVDPRSMRRLRQRLLAAQGNDGPDGPGGIRERLEALGILRPRTPQETLPMPSEQERLEALLSEDPDHVYSDEELDAIEEIDAEMALRIDRVQTAARRQGGVAVADGPIDEGRVREAVEEARKILMQDGGDIEFVAIEDRTVHVRLKGACVGCPRSTLDLRNVVERLVRSKEPGVARVVNTF